MTVLDRAVTGAGIAASAPIASRSPVTTNDPSPHQCASLSSRMASSIGCVTSVAFPPAGRRPRWRGRPAGAQRQERDESHEAPDPPHCVTAKHIGLRWPSQSRRGLGTGASSTMRPSPHSYFLVERARISRARPGSFRASTMRARARRLPLADAHARARVGAEILHPPGALAVLGDDVEAALEAGEPDLDLAREAGAPAARGQVEVGGLAHAPKERVKRARRCGRRGPGGSDGNGPGSACPRR